MITLASASAVRARVLSAAGVAFAVEPAPDEIEEPLKARLVAEGASAPEIARQLSLAKARAVWERRGGVVIGADQTLEFEGALLNKAASVEIARERLAAFRGRQHRLHAAVAVVGEDEWSLVETATLTVRDFSDAFLDGYLVPQRRGGAIQPGVLLLRGRGRAAVRARGGGLFRRAGIAAAAAVEAVAGPGGDRNVISSTIPPSSRAEAERSAAGDPGPRWARPDRALGPGSSAALRFACVRDDGVSGEGRW